MFDRKPIHFAEPDHLWWACQKLDGLLKTVQEQGIEPLRLQGFTDADLFEIRRIRAAFHSVNVPEPTELAGILRSTRRIADLLDPICERRAIE